MSIRDRLPSGALNRELRDQKTTFSELKAAQTRGSGSILTYRVFSSNVYDATMTSSGGVYVLRRIDVEFIPDDLTFGGAFCHRLEVKALNTSNAVVRSPFIIQRRRSVDGRQQWSVFYETFGDPSSTRRLKFYFFATGSGTFTTTVVN